jgi:hypothetical protein
MDFFPELKTLPIYYLTLFFFVDWMLSNPRRQTRDGVGYKNLFRQKGFFYSKKTRKSWLLLDRNDDLEMRCLLEAFFIGRVAVIDNLMKPCRTEKLKTDFLLAWIHVK